MNRNVLITGASSGIGKSCAFRFAKGGDNIILCGRRLELLNQCADEIQKTFKVHCLVLEMDVRNNQIVKNALNQIPDLFKPIDILINNAGLASGMEPIQNGDTEDWDLMIDTNIKGVLYVTKAVLPLMAKSNYPHIINIGSIAGKEVYPSGNVYCASKHAVDALSKAMRMDLLSDGIKVTQIAPGAVETEFSLIRFKHDSARAKKVYEGYAPLHPDDVAEVTYYSTTLPPHVNINDLVIMPSAQASAGNIKRKS